MKKLYDFSKALRAGNPLAVARRIFSIEKRLDDLEKALLKVAPSKVKRPRTADDTGSDRWFEERMKSPAFVKAYKKAKAENEADRKAFRKRQASSSRKSP